MIGLYKTEVINRRALRRHVEAVELATLKWVDSFNPRQLLTPIGHIPPVEYEEQYYRSQEAPVAAVGVRHVIRSPENSVQFTELVACGACVGDQGIGGAAVELPGPGLGGADVEPLVRVGDSQPLEADQVRSRRRSSGTGTE